MGGGGGGVKTEVNGIIALSLESVLKAAAQSPYTTKITVIATLRKNNLFKTTYNVNHGSDLTGCIQSG